mgnify:CR=1 FL=1
MGFDRYKVVAMDYVAFRDTCLEMTDMIDRRMNVIAKNNDISRTVKITASLDGHEIDVKNFKRLEEFIEMFHNSPVIVLKYDFKTSSYSRKNGVTTYNFSLELYNTSLKSWMYVTEDMSETSLPLDLSIMIRNLAKRYKGAWIMDPSRHPKWARATMALSYLLPIGLADIARIHHPNEVLNAGGILVLGCIVQSGVNAVLGAMTNNLAVIKPNLDCLKRMPAVTKS